MEQSTYYLCKVVNIGESGDTRRGGGGIKRVDRALAQLAAVTVEERGGLYWPGPQQLLSTLHRSQWKFIFPIGYISFRIRLD